MFQKGGSLFCDMTANRFDSVLLQQKILLVDNLNGFFEPLEQPVFKCYVAQCRPPSAHTTTVSHAEGRASAS